MADYWKIGGAMAAQDAANQARKTAKEVKKTNELLAEQNRLLGMSEQERIAEAQEKKQQKLQAEQQKQAKMTAWTIILGALLLLGACITYPILGIIVALIVAIYVIYKLKKRNQNTQIEEKSKTTVKVHRIKANDKKE